MFAKSEASVGFLKEVIIYMSALKYLYNFQLFFF